MSNRIVERLESTNKERTMLHRFIFTRCSKTFPIIVITLALIAWPDAGLAQQIRVGYGSLSTSYAAIWVAGEARLFQKNGIDAEVLYLESALVRTALLTVDIALGGMSGTTMAAPRLQGGDPILIASFLNSLQYRLVVRPEIRTVADLKGKRVGVGGRGALVSEEWHPPISLRNWCSASRNRL